MHLGFLLPFWSHFVVIFTRVPWSKLSDPSFGVFESLFWQRTVLTKEISFFHYALHCSMIVVAADDVERIPSERKPVLHIDLIILMSCRQMLLLPVIANFVTTWAFATQSRACLTLPRFQGSAAFENVTIQSLLRYAN